MRKLFFLFAVTAALLVPSFALASLAGSVPTDMVYISNETRIKVREQPDAKADQLGWAESGMEYPYLGSVSTWYCIDFEGKVGYMSSSLGRIVPKENGARYATITSPNGINVRVNADSNSRQIGKADQKDIFLYMGEENGWNKILCDGKVGYISQKLSTVSAESGNSGHIDANLDGQVDIDEQISVQSLTGGTPADRVRIANDTRINIRKGPSGESGKLGWAEPDEEFDYLGTTAMWHCIDYHGEIGYVSYNLGEIVMENDSKAQYVAVTNPSACNVRMSASAESGQIGKADPGDKFLYKGEENGWYKILFNGKTGYVSSKLTQLTDGITEFSRTAVSLYRYESADEDEDDDDDGGAGTRKKCKKCYGTGGCHTCFGAGRAYRNGRMYECHSCGGNGRCFFCGGFGYDIFAP